MGCDCEQIILLFPDDFKVTSIDFSSMENYKHITRKKKDEIKKKIIYFLEKLLDRKYREFVDIFQCHFDDAIDYVYGRELYGILRQYIVNYSDDDCDDCDENTNLFAGVTFIVIDYDKVKTILKVE